MLITFLWSSKWTSSIKLQARMGLEPRKLQLILASTTWELNLPPMSRLAHISTLAIGLWEQAFLRTLLTNIRKLRLRRERRTKVHKWWRTSPSTRLSCQTSNRILTLKKTNTSMCWHMVTSTVDKSETSHIKHLATRRTAWSRTAMPKKVSTHKWWE